METKYEGACLRIQGLLVYSQRRALEHWVENFEVQFSWPNFTMGLSLLLPNKTIQADVSLPSEMEVIAEVGLHKARKVVGLNGLSSYVFKNGGGVLISGLKNSWDQSGEGVRFLSTDMSR